MQYHAHLFFDLSDIDNVTQIHECLTHLLPEQIWCGSLLLKAVGPLPKPMFQIEFDHIYLAQVQQVLKIERQHYSVLIHPVLDDEYVAHTQYAIWLGKPLNLKLDAL